MKISAKPIWVIVAIALSGCAAVQPPKEPEPAYLRNTDSEIIGNAQKMRVKYRMSYEVLIPFSQGVHIETAFEDLAEVRDPLVVTQTLASDALAFTVQSPKAEKVVPYSDYRIRVRVCADEGMTNLITEHVDRIRFIAPQ